MMTTTSVLTSFADLLAPPAGAGTSAGADAGTAAGVAFNAILTTMLPAQTGDAPVVSLPAPAVSGDLPAEAATPLTVLLPGLALGEGAATPAGDEVPAGVVVASTPDETTDSDTTEAAVPGWLPALPLTAPLQAVRPVTAGSTDPATAPASALVPAMTGRPEQRQAAAVVAGAPGEVVEAGDDSSATQPVAASRDAQTRPAQPAAWLPPAAAQATAGAASVAPGTAAMAGGQGLEGLLRSREGRLVHNIESGGELTALTLTSQASQPFSGVAAREPATLVISQNALQSPDWGDAFNRHIVTLAQQGTQSASIQLNPEDLGPIHVRVSVHEQAASVEFAARHAATSELIESALPRLAGALESQGLRLDDVRLSQLPARADGFSLASGAQGQAGGDGRGQGGGAAAGSGRTGGDTEPMPVARAHINIAGPDGVDAYA